MEKVITYYLEMHSPLALVSDSKNNGLVIQECEMDVWEVNRFLYQYVGKQWHWRDKLVWNDEQWKYYVEQSNLRTWIGYWKGAIAGYFELISDSYGNIEIVYFGLADVFIGKGFGGYFLSQAIKYAWTFEGAKRVWVHTCTLDHPRALTNYQARGLSLYREEIENLEC